MIEKCFLCLFDYVWFGFYSNQNNSLSQPLNFENKIVLSNLKINIVSKSVYFTLFHVKCFNSISVIPCDTYEYFFNS